MEQGVPGQVCAPQVIVTDVGDFLQAGFCEPVQVGKGVILTQEADVHGQVPPHGAPILSPGDERGFHFLGLGGIQGVGTGIVHLEEGIGKGAVRLDLGIKRENSVLQQPCPGRAAVTHAAAVQGIYLLQAGTVRHHGIQGAEIAAVVGK